MYSPKKLLLLISFLAMLLIAGNALAGAKIPINDTSYFDLGFRVQALGINTDGYKYSDFDASDPDMGLKDQRYFKVRRARFRLKGVINEKFSAFLQTDASNKDVVLIDAFITVKADKWLQFIMGRNMAPVMRQNLTSSGVLMTIDRPGLAYRPLTWGARSLHTFANATYVGSGLASSPDAVRDNGLTLFGSGQVGESGGFKYYAGIYNGIQAGQNDEDRFAFRAQYNFWNPEAGYFQSSTYLGKKKTLGIGFAYDVQKEAGAETTTDAGLADYSLWTADAFLELPTGGGSFTLEGAYTNSDFGDHVDYKKSQGTGFYGQAGYYLNSGWQPWVLYETFTSDADADADGNVLGSYTSFRVGLTWFLQGQQANIKLGYESFKSEVPMDAKDQDTVNSVVLGFYTTY